MKNIHHHNDYRAFFNHFGTLISLDYELDGLNPHFNSIRSIGAVAILKDGSTKEFSVNVLPQEGKTPDPTSMEFWKHPDNAKAWAALSDPAPISLNEAWDKFDSWLKDIPGKKTLISRPLKTEKSFTDYVYQQRGLDPKDTPLGKGGMDMRKLAGQVLGNPHGKGAAETQWPLEEWLEGIKPYTEHISIDDARVHAYILLKMIEQGIRDNTLGNALPGPANTRDGTGR